MRPKRSVSNGAQVIKYIDDTWDPNNQQNFIQVSDNGNGMTWDMVRYAYLDVGRDCREVEKNR